MADVLRTIVIVVTHTPIWVWGLYALLLFLGFQRTRDGTIPLWRMLILPAVVMTLAIVSVIGAGLGALPAALIGLAVGSTAGWLMERDGGTRRLPDGRVWLRGEWWSFAQLLVVLAFRYVINVVAAMDPLLNADPAWHLGTVGLGTALSAMFLGRTGARLRVYLAPATAPVSG